MIWTSSPSRTIPAICRRVTYRLSFVSYSFRFEYRLMTRTGRSDDVADGDADVSGFVSKIVLLTRFDCAGTNLRVHYCAVSHAENARSGAAIPAPGPSGANLELDGVSVRYPG